MRLDLAPYYSYLRRRRGYDERAGRAAAPVSGLAIAELPTGEVLIAYAGGGTLRVLRRCEECWQQAVAVGGVSGVGRGCRLGSARVRRRPQSHRGKLTAAIDQRV